MLLIHEIRLSPNEPREASIAVAMKRLGLQRGAVAEAHIHRVSVDARRKSPVFVYSVALSLSDPAVERCFPAGSRLVRLADSAPDVPECGQQLLPGPVVVCGMGPAGLFAALELAEAGYAPLVLERGPELSRRIKAVETFMQGGELDENANIQFGEGGAGAFSDGKLTTRIHDPLCRRVTERLLSAGAPQEIAWLAKPHIGTDLLRGVLLALRQRLVALGGRVEFNTAVTGFELRGGSLVGVHTAKGDMPCGALLLAVGHSARDTFTALAEAGVPLAAKPFSVGYRIEHLQSDIDRGLYHGAAGHPALPPGEYQLSAKVLDRGVYTFCMCPGGSVVAACSERGTVVTNGMSLHARGGPNANAAIVAGVDGADFGGDPFAAMEFQRELERAAYKAGGGGYVAPAETLGSFLQGCGRLELERVQPSYVRGVRATDLGALLPFGLGEAIRAGLVVFGRKLPGYAAADAVLTGLETRTSSPVRIPRGEGYECPHLPGLWPCGEGAGYAGGIMSAAVDGVRAARALMARYAAP